MLTNKRTPTSSKSRSPPHSCPPRRPRKSPRSRSTSRMWQVPQQQPRRPCTVTAAAGVPSDVLTFFSFVQAVGPWSAVISVNHVAGLLEAQDKLAEAIRSTSRRSRRLGFVHPSALIVVGSPCAGLWLSHWLPAALAFALAAASFGRIPRVACSPCVRAGCGFQGCDGPLRSRWHPLPVRYSGKAAGFMQPLRSCWLLSPLRPETTCSSGERRPS